MALRQGGDANDEGAGLYMYPGVWSSISKTSVLVGLNAGLLVGLGVEGSHVSSFCGAGCAAQVWKQCGHRIYTCVMRDRE